MLQDWPKITLSKDEVEKNSSSDLTAIASGHDLQSRKKGCFSLCD